MSSILDALKKLEKEKEAPGSPPVSRATPKGGMRIEQRIVPLPERDRDRVMARWIAGAIVAAGLIIGLCIMMGLLGSTFLVARSGAGNGTPGPYEATSAPEVQPVVLPPVAPEEVAPIPDAHIPAARKTPARFPKPAEMIPIPAPGATGASNTPETDAAPAPLPERFPKPPDEKAPPNDDNQREPSTPPNPQSAIPNPPSPAPVDLSALPSLNTADRDRWGLAGLQVNMPLPANKNRPIASAIINMKTVRVGERIPNTKATLIAVDMRSIGIEIEETGQRFRVRF